MALGKKKTPEASINVEAVKAAPAKTVEPKGKQSKEEFIQSIREDLNASGFRDRHHPDMHHLGASPCCKGCDTSKESADQMWEAK